MSSDFYTALTEQSPHATFVYNVALKKFQYANAAFKSLFDADIDMLSPDDIISIIPQDEVEYLKKYYDQLLSGDITQSIDFRLQLKGDEQWLRLSTFLLPSEEGDLILGTAEVITDQVSNLETIKKYANKKNSILNILAHDLRGPLGIANTVTQLASKEVKDPHLTNMISTVSRILRQSIDLISDLTNREFLETVDVNLVKTRIDVVAKLRAIMEEYQFTQSLTKRTFVLKSSEESIFIDLDEAKFIQIINNLMTNSLKFTTDEGTISLCIKDQENSVLFEFADNGIGIPAQFNDTLFDKFTDARRTGLHGEPTVGLGLSIVKTIVDWHQGKIWFTSKEGEGTTFFVEIPK
jgi:two-component system, OmpR family, sensor histidine kinase VicK